MKHYRPITRAPAAAQTALAVKIEFKTSLSSLVFGATDVIYSNLLTIGTGLFQNSLNLGTIVEIIIEDIDFSDLFGGGGGGDDGGFGG